MDDLPTDFDVIVIGTGMTESIVAAAASRIGKTVLHLDSSDFYGGLWASFNFDGLQKMIEESKAKGYSKGDFGIFNVEDQWYIKESNKEVQNLGNDLKEMSLDNEATVPVSSEVEASDKEADASEGGVEDKDNEKTELPKIVWTQDKVKLEYRKFNVDLAPKLLFARGELVELLISSNIARYAEFRCVNRVLTWIGDVLEPVPCSRADVFATKHVSVVEKRMLMKLLTSFLEYEKTKEHEEFKGVENKTFLEFLKSKKLTGNLIHYVLYAIAGGTDTTPCFEGIYRCKRFLISLGRYGNTPFLWSMYGCGELPQCFCRLCAVFGGIYCLKRPIDSIKVEETADESKKTVQIHSNNKVLTCEHVVIGIDKVPKEFLSNTDFHKGISRAVFITNKSVLEFEKESLTLLQFPPLDGKSDPVTVIELGPSTSSCPKGLYLVHMTCQQSNTAKEDLQLYAEKLLSFDECDSVESPGKEGAADNGQKTKPQVLWSFYFNMVDTSQPGMCETSSSKIHLCSGPDIDLDFDHAVKQGREIFSKICPDVEFLPRAPDPEEIIFEGTDAEAGPEFEKNEKNVSESENESGNKNAASLSGDGVDGEIQP